MKHDPTYPTPAMRALFSAILELKNEQEASTFFRDLLTITELKEFANRWQAVRMLVQRKSYIEISEKLGMSTATVTRVAHWLNNGKGGYKVVANRLFPK